MKTPMQIALEKFNKYDLSTGKSGFRRILKELLPKEKQMIIDAYRQGEKEATQISMMRDKAEQYFKDTYNER